MNKYVQKYLPPLVGAYYNTLAFVAPGQAGKQAFYTFCTIRKGRVLPQQEEFLNAARKEKLQAGKHQVQVYQWRGSGDTILLLHGWESNVFRWRNLISVLKEYDFNILAYDAPGHGYSEGKILNVPIYSECTRAAIDAYDPQHIIGHSVGGMTAIYTLAHHKENNVKKVVTLGAPNEFFEIVDDYQNILGFNSRVYRALDDYIHDRYRFRIREFKSTRYAKELKQKALLVHDKKDAIIPVHASKQVHKSWPNSELVLTEGLGHSLHQEAVNRVVADFIKA